MAADTTERRGLRAGVIFRGARGGFLVEATASRGFAFRLRRWCWRVDIRFVSLGSRTALRIWPRGVSLWSALQGQKITTGDPDVDERFAVWGSVPDVARAVIEHARVKSALGHLHRTARLHEVALHPIGHLEVRLEHEDGDREDPSPLVDACVRLARSFEDAADAAPLERRLLDRRGIGGASGCPVGVPSAV